MRIPARTVFLESEDFVTVKEFASFLRIASMTGYRIVRSGEIEGALRVGRSYRLPLSGVRKYLASIGFDPGELTLADFAEDEPAGEYESA